MLLGWLKIFACSCVLFNYPKKKKSRKEKVAFFHLSCNKKSLNTMQYVMFRCEIIYTPLFCSKEKKKERKITYSQFVRLEFVWLDREFL